MIFNLIKSSQLFDILFSIDEDLAQKCRVNRCQWCEGVLHSAKYYRTLRGLLITLSEDQQVRFSLCCANKSCRKRHTPPSIRFLGRKVYSTLTILLLSALRNGISSKVAELFRKTLNVDRRTMKRWQSWWQETFPNTPLWKSRRGFLQNPPESGNFPLSLIHCFEGSNNKQLLTTLIFITSDTINLSLFDHFF